MLKKQKRLKKKRAENKERNGKESEEKEREENKEKNATTVVELEQKVIVAEAKLNMAKKLLTKANSINMEKDIQIKQLMHKKPQDTSNSSSFEQFVGHFGTGDFRLENYTVDKTWI